MAANLSLSELQHAFAEWLSGKESELTPHIKSHPLAAQLSPQQRMQIYQNNYLVSCTDALKATYPLTQQLVGNECFTQLARQWIKLYPPASGNIIEYGEGFAPWLTSQERLESLPYLADFAALEWRVEQTCHAELNESPFPFTELAEVDECRFGLLAFQLAPQYRLVASDYAIGDIYHMLQKQQVEALDFYRPQHLLLQKQSDFSVTLHPVEPLAYQFLVACQQQKTLETIAQTMAMDPSLYLQRFIQQGVLSRFVCKEV
ncbi:HvfC/BufC N-terminal domain-containing protein [Motilimonas eburnea]|uniref:HvfC/BufC N-terminal domain-containing protein n=1 Tax=Motilimonas eburnea TaxID=1737488 RepID=UPI001E4F327B|nr:DNA-binding domain-containing protein [Motilimonas eburnea]MCE2573005.1 DNA-binding domain-containing protein [Motilimonas eburnea]